MPELLHPRDSRDDGAEHGKGGRFTRRTGRSIEQRCPTTEHRRPSPPEEIQRAGLAYRASTNWGDSKSLIRLSLSDFRLFEVTPLHGTASANPQAAD